SYSKLLAKPLRDVSTPEQCWVSRNFDAIGRPRDGGQIFASQRPIARNRRLSSSIPARPYICRFNSFNLLMYPSTGPLLHGNVSGFITASMSCSRLLAKPLRGASDDPPARSSHDLRVSAFLSVRITRKSCRSVYVSRAA